jgi:Protein of unknown function (DUF3108)
MRAPITALLMLLTGLSQAAPCADTLHKVPAPASAPQDTTTRPDQTFCSGIRNTAFNAGEQLTYRVYYAVAGAYIAAGEAMFTTTLEKFDHKDVYHVVGEGKTYSFEDKFFRVRDRYESYIDTGTLQPYKFIRDVDEGGYKTKENVTFYQGRRDRDHQYRCLQSAGLYPGCAERHFLLAQYRLQPA